jgi:hypothetical protein
MNSATGRTRLLPQIRWVSVLLVLSEVNTGAQAPRQDLKPVDAVQGVVAAFQQHPVVIVGEAHWLRRVGDFYINLVRDPVFQGTVQDIVIEFASANNQPLLDRYIAGENVPLEDVRHIWRDTSKVASWESPIYAEWLAAIREVNKKLRPASRLRVLAGDTPINWSLIRTHSDWAALGDNNISITNVIIEQVLKKKRRALVVLGSNHVTKSGGRDGTDNVTTRLESHYPGCAYVLLLDSPRTVDPAAQDLLHLSDRGTPTLYELRGTQLARATGKDGH